MTKVKNVNDNDVWIKRIGDIWRTNHTGVIKPTVESADVNAWSKRVTAVLETHHLSGIRLIVEAAMTSAKSSSLETEALELFNEHVDVFARRDWAGERVVYAEINARSPLEVLGLQDVVFKATNPRDYEARFCIASAVQKLAEPDSLLDRFATCIRDNYAYGISARIDHFVRNKPSASAAAPK